MNILLFSAVNPLISAFSVGTASVRSRPRRVGQGRQPRGGVFAAVGGFSRLRRLAGSAAARVGFGLAGASDVVRRRITRTTPAVTATPTATGSITSGRWMKRRPIPTATAAPTPSSHIRAGLGRRKAVSARIGRRGALPARLVSFPACRRRPAADERPAASATAAGTDARPENVGRSGSGKSRSGGGSMSTASSGAPNQVADRMRRAAVTAAPRRRADRFQQRRRRGQQRARGRRLSSAAAGRPPVSAPRQGGDTAPPPDESGDASAPIRPCSNACADRVVEGNHLRQRLAAQSAAQLALPAAALDFAVRQRQQDSVRSHRPVAPRALHQLHEGRQRAVGQRLGPRHDHQAVARPTSWAGWPPGTAANRSPGSRSWPGTAARPSGGAGRLSPRRSKARPRRG